ncbi:MAG: ABC transporter substrate-binding protein, partial [Bacteroidetes bacterium]|nr:ABC transporter substrate-binding protein [Bacteroidota bacterium]
MKRAAYALILAMMLSGCSVQQDLTVANSTDISTLDPFGMFSRVEVAFGDHIFQTLTFFNRDMEIEPLLAESWERLEGDTTWAIHLRSGVTFHNGAPFDAEAAKWSIEQYYVRNASGQMIGGAAVAVP